MVARKAPGIVAVLTGDLVNSTRMPAERHERVRDLLIRAARDSGRWTDRPVSGPDFYRGDAWQLVLEEPRLFLRLAVWLQAHLAAEEDGAETRIAIGIGAAEVIERKAVSRSIGEAFTLSGRALDDMGRRRGLELALSASVPTLPWLRSQVSACEFIVSTWTRSQAKVALQFLVPDTPLQQEAAKALNRHSQSVSRTYRDAGIYVLLDILETVEAAEFVAVAGRSSESRASAS